MSSNSNDKAPLFSLTKKDFRWDYYKRSGKGGQKRNKTENCCCCSHLPSGTVGKSEEGRSKEKNRKQAFRRMANTPEFQKWIQIEAAKHLGLLEETEKKIEEQLKNIKTEVYNDGEWQEYKRDEGE